MATAARPARAGFRQGRSPALQSLALHALAWLPAVLLPLPYPTPLITQGGLAFVLSRGFGLPAWWQLINLLFFPLVGLAITLELEPGWFLIAFALLALTSLGSLVNRVPLYLSGRRAIAALLASLPDRPAARFIDLGCGFGGVLAGLKAQRPDLHLSGVEVAPFNWMVSRLRLGARAKVDLGSLWDVDLGAYDVVYAFLSPAVMERLWAKVEREMRPGSLFISNSFAVPGREPDRSLPLGAIRQGCLLLWQR